MKKKPTTKGSRCAGLEPLPLPCPFASPFVVAGGHVGDSRLLFTRRAEVGHSGCIVHCTFR